MRYILSVFIVFNIIIGSAKAQENEDFGFEQKYNIAVTDSLGKCLEMPWLGGMNACQFCEIDLNFDNIKDLLVFDRHGSRVFTFINNNIKNNISYTYAPQYVPLFPHFDNWVQFHDYNNDGKNDIFTYTLGGIMIYKNTSHDGEIKFEKVIKRYLTSLQGELFTNILVTSVDYPGIIDIDNDGDLDILTFWGLGSFVEYHQNQSMELYGIPDSLIYHKQETCWGYFAESDESNTIYLDTCINGGILPPSGPPKHTGSTFLVYDFENDGDKDLVLGDVDYPGLVALTNGGNSDEARIISQNWSFPNSDNPIHLFSFPVATNIDVNNDGDKDIIVSSFDPSFDLSKFKNNTLLYLNDNTNEENDFVFHSNNFLQGEMLDLGAGAYPVIADIDNDGLKDIVIANYGQLDSTWYDVVFALHCEYKSSITFLKNVGTLNQPAFKIITENLIDLTDYDFTALYPACGDIDNDGDLDIICGNENGNLILCENIGTKNNVPQYNITTNYQNIDIGYFSTPQLFDINNDGLLDLLIGEKEGNINYFQNIGSKNNPVFSLVTEMLGNVDVTNINLSYQGYSVPSFFNDKGVTKLFVGSEFGKLFYYNNIDDNLSGNFKMVSGNYLYLDKGWRSAYSVNDLNNDGYIDLLIGNYAGGIEYLQGTSPSPINIQEIENNTSVIISPNPAKDFINVKSNNNKKLKAKIYSINGALIKEHSFNNSIKIDITNLKNSIYFITISDNNTVYSRKKIIKI